MIGEVGRAPQKGVSTSGNGNSADGRDHWPYCYTSIVAGAGTKRGFVLGSSDKTGSSPAEDPVHPTELLATMYNAVGIEPETVVYNHLNQPRELVKAKPSSAKGAYIKSISMSSTMSPGVKVESRSIS